MKHNHTIKLSHHFNYAVQLRYLVLAILLLGSGGLCAQDVDFDNRSCYGAIIGISDSESFIDGNELVQDLLYSGKVIGKLEIETIEKARPEFDSGPLAQLWQVSFREPMGRQALENLLADETVFTEFALLCDEWVGETATPPTLDDPLIQG